jgi:hypothetical protein
VVSKCLLSKTISEEDLIKIEEVKSIKTGNMYLDSIIYTCVNKIKENMEKMNEIMQGSVLKLYKDGI